MTLVLLMTNDHGQHYEDACRVAVSTRFYVWFKYLLVGPVLLVVAPLLLLQKFEVHSDGK